MDRRKLVMAGVVVASMVLGGVLGVLTVRPGAVGAATGAPWDPAATGSISDGGDRPHEECFGSPGLLGYGFRPLEVAAETIGIETTELLAALRDGETIAEVAERSGVDPQDVVDAIVAAERERVEDAVDDGDLTQEQADRLLAFAEERATRLVEGAHPGRPFQGRFGGGWAGPWGPADGPMAAALGELGIDLSELLDELEQGRTIAEVAQELGVDLDAVIDAMVDAFRVHLDRAVEEGWLSREEADERATGLRERVEAIVNGELGAFPFPGRLSDLGPGFGHDGGFGPGSSWPEDGSGRGL
jgi:uncharacterized protein (DUF433 family)